MLNKTQISNKTKIHIKSNFTEAPYDDQTNDVVQSSDYVTITNCSRRGYKTNIWLYFDDKQFILEN